MRQANELGDCEAQRMLLEVAEKYERMAQKTEERRREREGR